MVNPPENVIMVLTKSLIMLSYDDYEICTLKPYPASCWSSPVYASLRNWLASTAGIGIDVPMTECHRKTVCHPAHLTFTSAHVWSRHINSWPCGVMRWSHQRLAHGGMYNHIILKFCLMIKSLLLHITNRKTRSINYFERSSNIA